MKSERYYVFFDKITNLQLKNDHVDVGLLSSATLPWVLNTIFKFVAIWFLYTPVYECVGYNSYSLVQPFLFVVCGTWIFLINSTQDVSMYAILNHDGFRICKQKTMILSSEFGMIRFMAGRLFRNFSVVKF